MPQRPQQPPVKHAEKMRRKAIEMKHLQAAKGGRMDVPFLLLVLLLTAIGLVMLFSASFPSAFTRPETPPITSSGRRSSPYWGFPPCSWWQRSTISAGAARPGCC